MPHEADRPACHVHAICISAPPSSAGIPHCPVQAFVLRCILSKALARELELNHVPPHLKPFGGSCGLVGKPLASWPRCSLHPHQHLQPAASTTPQPLPPCSSCCTETARWGSLSKDAVPDSTCPQPCASRALNNAGPTAHSTAINHLCTFHAPAHRRTGEPV